MNDPKDERTWDAILKLLDDESSRVRGVILDFCMKHELEAALHIRNWATSHYPIPVMNAANQIREEMIQRGVRSSLFKIPTPVHPAKLRVKTIERFVEFIQSQRYELETGMLLMDRVANPKYEAEELEQELTRLAARCQELLVAHHSPREVIKVINRVLFHEEGYRGNQDDFHNPSNSFLSSVLETRKGIPISLGILYILVAGRIGIELTPVCMPGKFVIGCFWEPTPFYLDPYERGALKKPEDLFLWIQSQGMVPEVGHLAPSPVREVLCRCCRNLVHQYLSVGDLVKSRMFARFVHEFESTHRREASS